MLLGLGRQRGCGCAPAGPDDWPHWTGRAFDRLAARLRQAGELTPARAARVALSALPRPQAARWLRELRRRGWLRAEARLSTSDFDSPARPAAFRGPQRELLRLALFGPPGQGANSESRHREAVYQQLFAEIMREARDQNSLHYVTARALSHPEVLRDPSLDAMIRSCIAQREEELRDRLSRQRVEQITHVQPWHSIRSESSRGTPTGEQILAQFHRIQAEFNEKLTHFDAASGRSHFLRLEALFKRYPDIISRPAIERCRMDLAHVEQRCGKLLGEIQRLGERAVEAAAAGNHELAARSVRRLSAIRAARPALLSDAQFEAIRKRIAESGERFEHREAVQALLRRERAVADEIKRLARGVHEFHEVLRTLPLGDERFAAAEAEYRRTLKDVRSHDNEWLAELMLELEDLLEELHDATGRAGGQVERFVASVRGALLQVRKEILQIAGEAKARAAAARPAAPMPLAFPHPSAADARPIAQSG